MNLLNNIKALIDDFNTSHNETFSIDTIRITFSKQHKLEPLKRVGKWNKINKNNQTMLEKLKARLNDDELTSAYQLENENIYYYNIKEPKYIKASLIIFGMKQYHKDPPKLEYINEIISILKNISSIDVCLDFPYKPNITALQRVFDLKQFITKDGVITNTYYINNTNINFIDRIIIYDKALKNNLGSTLYRIEATISIPNIKAIYLPLQDLKEIMDIAKFIS